MNIVKKSMYILDTMALAHRFYWSVKDKVGTDKQGRSIEISTVLTDFLDDFIREFNPTYIVAAAESKTETFRHEMYSEYKANRKEKDEGLVRQLGDFYKVFDKFNIPCISIDSFEADDIIGTITHKYASDSMHCYIVSGDKDFMQLVNENVSILRPDNGGEFTIINAEDVLKKTGVTPDQFIDYLSLVGDTADNIPGVLGIGPKGASTLLNTYKNLDGIYSNLHNIKGKNREKLAKSIPNLILSKKLVIIVKDVDIPDFLVR